MTEKKIELKEIVKLILSLTEEQKERSYCIMTGMKMANDLSRRADDCRTLCTVERWKEIF